MSEAFSRLSPAVQYQIVNGLGFQSLRPVQELTIGPVLDGKNCVVLAPTAGGKTEAAFFPLLSRMDEEDWKAVSVIYVAPIRALLNNQEERVSSFAKLIGRRAAVWHGDTTQSERRAFIQEPADILLTTPESLEVMLMSRKVPARRLFQNLRAVVIDEIHAFVADDRGGHLSALLERLSRFCGKDIQRIGLSATVGNPEEILAWVAGSSQRKGALVRASGLPREPQLMLDFVGSRENAARIIAALHPGKKRLVFVDSRRGVEAVGTALRGLGVDTHVTHSSLSVAERRRAEEAFAQGKNCVIVATSALELGIDIGDLDHVIQVGCPSSVASFLQRMGRSGRRPGTNPNCTFLATDEESLVQSAALLRLYKSGFVEPVRPRRYAAHLLAHQVMALCIQEEGVPESDWWGWVSQATPFSGMTPEDRQELLEHMLAADILFRDGGRLGLGRMGEKLYGARNFTELYAVFSSPSVLRVLWGQEEVGTIDAYFAEQETPEKLVFTLGARSWRATAVEWNRGIVYVQPAEHGAPARWQGMGTVLHREMCLSIRDVLTSREEDPWWSRRARERLQQEREEHAFLDEAPLPLETEPGGMRLWTFGGLKANLLLGRILESILGERVTANNLSLGLKGRAGESEVAVREALARLRQEGRPTREDAIALGAAPRGMRLSKFEPCLPPRLEAIFTASVLTDAPSAKAILAS